MEGSSSSDVLWVSPVFPHQSLCHDVPCFQLVTRSQELVHAVGNKLQDSSSPFLSPAHAFLALSYSWVTHCRVCSVVSGRLQFIVSLHSRIIYYAMPACSARVERDRFPQNEWGCSHRISSPVHTNAHIHSYSRTLTPVALLAHASLFRQIEAHAHTHARAHNASIHDLAGA